MGLYGNVAGGFGMPKMIEITDDNGNTLIGTVTDSEVVFDATRDDVKIGKIFASADGVQEGIDTRTYRTTHAWSLVLPGEEIVVTATPVSTILHSPLKLADCKSASSGVVP